MISIAIAREIALSLPGAEEHEHCGRPSFRIKKTIFATVLPKEKRFVLKFNTTQQSVYVQMNKNIFYPVTGAWGLKGYTYVELSNIPKSLFREAITIAWEDVVKK